LASIRTSVWTIVGAFVVDVDVDVDVAMLLLVLEGEIYSSSSAWE
jgi:hypothetical protein